LHHSYYKKPVKIFEKLAASPELMGALKEERKRRDTLMETSFEWEDWFDGKQARRIKARSPALFESDCALFVSFGFDYANPFTRMNIVGR